jgi:hypothetical protein
MHRPGMIDAAFNDHVDIKIVLVEVKETFPIVYLDNLHALAAPEFF